MEFKNLVCCAIFFTVMCSPVLADHTLSVLFMSYVNELQHCSVCRQTTSEDFGCCDSHTDKTFCTEIGRCDTYLLLCLGSVDPRCDITSGIRTPEFNIHDTEIDLRMIPSGSGTLLGLRNPQRFSESDSRFNGAILRVRAVDNDGLISNSDIDEIIDDFEVLLNSPSISSTQPEPTVYNLTGAYNISRLSIGVSISCDPGFSGPNCVSDQCLDQGTECNNNGMCIDDMCSCDPGFTGRFCETGGCIDDCSGNGICSYQGLIEGFVCDCNPGFTGSHCEIQIDVISTTQMADVISSTGVELPDPCFEVVCAADELCAPQTREGGQVVGVCVCDDGFNGMGCTTVAPPTPDWIPLAGGLAGAILFMVLCILIVLIIVCAVCRKPKPAKEVGTGNGDYAEVIVVQPNPIYQMTQDTSGGVQYDEVKTPTLRDDDRYDVGVANGGDTDHVSECGSDYVPVDQSEYDYVIEPTYEEIPAEKNT